MTCGRFSRIGAWSASAAGAALLLAALTGIWPALAEQAKPLPVPARDFPDDSELARGAYLSRIGGCQACHTAVSQGQSFAGGRAVPSPLGTIFSTNITPDPRYGIGRYSFEDFRRAVQQGRAPGGRNLYPAMPYTAYAKVADDDLRAIYRYLRTVPASSDVPPKNDVTFPFNQRWALRAWQWAFLPSPGFQPRADRSAEWNRGAYLVQGGGHCGACHTPRGPAFEERGNDERSSHFLTGQVNDHWYASNLTGDPGAGLGRVDATTIATFLRTGDAGGHVAFGTMAEEVEGALRHLSAEDAAAIATYLKDLPAQRHEGAFVPNLRTASGQPQGNHTTDLESAGAAGYRRFCAQCHGADGQGRPGLFPRLAGNPVLLSDDASSLIRLVLEGGSGPKLPDRPAPPSMPGFIGTLSDLQIAQVLTYIREMWGNSARQVTTSDVARLHQALRK